MLQCDKNNKAPNCLSRSCHCPRPFLKSVIQQIGISVKINSMTEFLLSKAPIIESLRMYYYISPTFVTSIRRNNLPSYTLSNRLSPKVFAASRNILLCVVKTPEASDSNSSRCC